MSLFEMREMTDLDTAIVSNGGEDKAGNVSTETGRRKTTGRKGTCPMKSAIINSL